MRNFKSKLSQFKMPHTYVILTIILLLVVLLTYLIPAGQYDRVLDDVSGKMVVVADSFHATTGVRPGLFDIFLSLQRGYVSAANILFLIVFAYGYVYMLIDNGTLHNSINVLIRTMGNKTHLLIPVCMMLFGLLGSTLGIYEEVYGLVPVFIGIAVALGYDTVVGGAIVFVGIATGFAAATTNPFSIGIAQSIAEVPMFSGLGYRILIFLTFESVSIWYVMRYAKKVKQHPEKSILYGEKIEVLATAPADNSVFTLRQKICLVLFCVTIGTLLYGTMK
ncbi:MAG: YfcC family protein, partial [Pygmaiobacter sp.]